MRRVWLRDCVRRAVNLAACLVRNLEAKALLLLPYFVEIAHQLRFVSKAITNTINGFPISQNCLPTHHLTSNMAGSSLAL